MPYDRYAAIGYAKRYWDQPCDDGVIWRNDRKIHIADERARLHAAAKDGWEPRFVRDSNGDEEAVFERFFGGQTERLVIQQWAGLADCAHFLSRCLTAGGLKIDEISVPMLISHLKRRSDVKVLAEQVNRERGQMIVDSGVFKSPRAARRSLRSRSIECSGQL